MAKLNQLIMLENMMRTYDQMNIKDADLTKFQGMCTEKLVDEIIEKLTKMVVSKTRLSSRNVLLANYETMTKTTYWLGCKLFSDLPRAESRVLREKVEQMVELLNELMLKIVDVDEEYARRFFERIKKAYCKKRITDFELWIAQQSQLTIERLKEYQTELTANMLIMGILKYDEVPSGRELENVDMATLRKHLRSDKLLPEDFEFECAKLRRYSHWEGDMFFIDFQLLRKYIFQHFGELTNEQHIAMFEYDIQLELIHEEMERLTQRPTQKPTPDPSQRGGEQSLLPESLATEKAMALWRKVQKAGYVDENYQPTISRTQAAMLADAMAERLKIKDKWKVFETLWQRKYMRSDYNLAFTRKSTLDFQDELKRLFG